jgi:transcriptional regulator with XRE-family HTH domain
MKERRKFLGISQAELAERAGISVGYVGELEIGRKGPTLETVELLAEALRTQPYRLLMTEKDRAEAAETAGREQVYAARKRLIGQIEEEFKGLLGSEEVNKGEEGDKDEKDGENT